MSEELKLLLEKSTLDILTIQEKETLFDLLRYRLINHNTYKWSIKKYKIFVSVNGLSYKKCYKALKQSTKARQDKKCNGVTEFILKIKKFNDLEDLNKIHITEGSKKAFLQGLQTLRLNYFKRIDNSEFLNFIDSNFEIGLNRNSLNVYYYKNINNKNLPKN